MINYVYNVDSSFYAMIRVKSPKNKLGDPRSLNDR